MQVFKCDKCKNVVENVYQIKYRRRSSEKTGTVKQLELCECCFKTIFNKLGSINVE